MKRYLAFSGDMYYPGMGMKDFIDDFDTIDDAIAKLTEKYKASVDWRCNVKWAVVWDSEKRVNVWTSDSPNIGYFG